VTILFEIGDGIVGERIVYIARIRSGERFIVRNGAHRGMSGILYDTKCWIEAPIKIKREWVALTVRSRFCTGLFRIMSRSSGSVTTFIRVRFDKT